MKEEMWNFSKEWKLLEKLNDNVRIKKENI